MVSVQAINSTDNNKTVSILSANTIKQLKELNIDPSSIKSESVAQKMIKEALKLKSEQSQMTKPEVASIDSEKLILRDIKLLAKRMGLKFNEELTFDVMFKRIYKKIRTENRLAEDERMENLDKRQMEYITLKTRYKTLKLKESSLINGLEQVSDANKLNFRLN